MPHYVADKDSMYRATFRFHRNGGRAGALLALRARGIADLLVAFGASLNSDMVDGSHMFSKGGGRAGRHRAAPTLKSGNLPSGRRRQTGPRSAILDKLRERGRTAAHICSAELVHCIKEDPADGALFPIDPGTLHAKGGPPSSTASFRRISTGVSGFRPTTPVSIP